MIKAFCGEFGSGKTLSMVSEASNWLGKGVRVVSNTPLVYNYFKFNKLSDILQKKSFGRWDKIESVFYDKLPQFFEDFKTSSNTIYCMDEAQLWLNNYAWNKIDDSIYNRFFQVRKVKIHLLYTSTYWGAVVAKLRMITNDVVECAVPLRLPPDKTIPYDQGKPIIVRNIYYDKRFYDYSTYSPELEQKFIKKRLFLYGASLNHAYRAFDSSRLISGDSSDILQKQ